MVLNWTADRAFGYDRLFCVYGEATVIADGGVVCIILTINRKASLTDAASGNNAATSGSNRTVTSGCLRPGPRATIGI
jgi:hypothetical protein